MAQLNGGNAMRVPTLGAQPPGLSGYPAQIKWTAGLRVQAYWNYAFRIGPGPSHLVIDGMEVLNVPIGTPSMEATVSLAAGDHAVLYEGTFDSAPVFEWAQSGVPDAGGNMPPLAWRPAQTEELMSQETQPRSLYGVVQVQDRPEQHLLSNTIAQCCLSGVVSNDGRPYTVTWTGSLDAPTTGTYTMTLLMEGTGHLLIDGRQLIQSVEPTDNPISAELALEAGKHTIELKMEAQNTRGDIELRWTPPGGQDSIVPPSVLSPPEGVGVGQPLDLTTFIDVPVTLAHQPLETTR